METFFLEEILIENAHNQLKVTVKHDRGQYTITSPAIVHWSKGENVTLTFPKLEDE